MASLRTMVLPSVLVALFTAAVAPEAAAGGPNPLIQADNLMQIAIRFAELLGVLYVGLKFILRPMLNDLLAPIKAEQQRVALALETSDERFDEMHGQVKEIGATVDTLSRDVAVALDRTDP